jgi:hypothetical protein
MKDPYLKLLILGALALAFWAVVLALVIWLVRL